MHLAKIAKDGKTVEAWEVHLCIGCCRMMCLNVEEYKQYWLVKEKCFIYAHTYCPPLKELKQLGVSNER